MTHDSDPAMVPKTDTNTPFDESFNHVAEYIEVLLTSDKSIDLQIKVQDIDGQVALRTERTCFLQLSDGRLWRVFTYADDNGTQNHCVEVSAGTDVARIYQLIDGGLVSDTYQINGTVIPGSVHMVNKDDVDHFHTHLRAAKPLSPKRVAELLKSETFEVELQG